MAQRYDAIVVDCENEQNASLIFKSARNSSSNQSSLAIALVEGQAGVAKAYRIGANLVLTKPINVEQAKGTLRVARGLLRKNSDAASASAAGSATPATPVKTAQPSGVFSTEDRRGSAIAPKFTRPNSELASPQGDASEVVAAFAPQSGNAAAGYTADASQVTLSGDSEKTANAALAAENPGFAFSTPGSAAAPAPAKEVTPHPENAPQTKATKAKTVAFENANRSHAGDPTPASDSMPPANSSSSAALDEEGSGGSGGNKKIMIAAAVILFAAAIGYLGYGSLGSSIKTPAPQSATAPQVSVQPTPAPVTAPSAEVEPSADATDQQSSATPAISSKAPSASPEPASKKPDTSPILVKSNSSRVKTRTQAEESEPPLPGALAVASASDSNLSGLMSTTSPTLAKPSLATLRISQGVSQGLLIKRVQPKYPQAALAAHTQGAVQIDATINKEGNVTNLKVVRGDPALARAAMDAVRQWRYKPYYLDGDPVEIETQITVNFKTN